MINSMVNFFKNTLKNVNGYSNGKKCIKSRKGNYNRLWFSIGNGFLLPFVPGKVIHKFFFKPRNTFFIKVVYYNGVVCFQRDLFNLSVGDFIFFCPYNTFVYFDFVGNSFFFKHMFSGISCSNISFGYKFWLSKIACAAGSFGFFLGPTLNKKSLLLRLPSKKVINIDFSIKGVIGVVAYQDSRLIDKKYTLASSMYLKGYKSHVRGVAKNPVDHPHGGGEGKSKSGRHPVNPWGFLTKGKKTRRKKVKKFFF